MNLIFGVLEKGRKALPIGTEKMWQGKLYVKQGDGTWKPKGGTGKRGRPAGAKNKSKTNTNKPDDDVQDMDAEKKAGVITLLKDVLDRATLTDDQRKKYIARLKELGVDYEAPKDDEYIKNADINNLKNKNDFSTYDQYRKYAEVIFAQRGFKGARGAEAWKHITQDELRDLIKKNNLDIEVKNARDGALAHSSTNDISIGEHEGKGTIIHELGHVIQHALESRGFDPKLEDIAYSPSKYGLTNGAEAFAEHVTAYYTAEGYASAFPEIAALLEQTIPVEYDRLARDILNFGAIQAPVAAKRGRGRPKGSKNRQKTAGAVANSSQDASAQEKGIRARLGLKSFDSGALSALQASTTRRDRMGYGQDVVYLGTYNPRMKDKRAKLVAIGDHGYAVLQAPSGETFTSAWRDMKPVGGIKPFSLYDDLDPNNVYYSSGKFKETLDRTMNQKIGNSGMTYADLCTEFKKRGFTLNVVGGTVRDILSEKTEIKDVDFIFDGSDNELQATLQKINPSWVKNAVTNGHLGLVSFTDGNDTVDITPVHKFSFEQKTMAKGWTLKDDAVSRDLAMNSLQVDPLTGVLVDATGKGIGDIENNTINFTEPKFLPYAPVYILRAFKFMARNYKLSDEAKTLLKTKFHHVTTLSPKRISGFLARQIGDKDGEKGLIKFKDLVSSMDSQIWNKHFEGIYRSVMPKYRGK